jgi:hypothetical protein
MEVSAPGVVQSVVVESADRLPESLLSASQPYVGRWNRLVSTTNWEKGRIICQWRDAVLAGDVDAVEYSDQAWSQLVGGVTSQHVGRLRRVFQRFGQVQEQFKGLFWSHFQSALDWDGAEMWLEGAVQSGWSVARMRQQRWETLGRVEADRPREGEIVAAETDEDYVAPGEGRGKEESPDTITGQYEEVQGPRFDGPDFGDDEPSSSGGSEWTIQSAEPAVDLVRPFENLPQLPDDLADAFESFKLALLHHKADGWQQVSCAVVLKTIDALKALATARP